MMRTSGAAEPAALGWVAGSGMEGGLPGSTRGLSGRLRWDCVVWCVIARGAARVCARGSISPQGRHQVGRVGVLALGGGGLAGVGDGEAMCGVGAEQADAVPG